MGRRAQRYCRNRSRQAFNSLWADITRPPAANGSRRCVDCARNGNCGLNRRGSHTNCFVKKDGEPGYSTETGEMIGCLIGIVSLILLFFLIALGI